MVVRCSHTEPNPTHDISFEDRNGILRGFIMCDANGERKESWHRVPVERTAFKTTTGNSQYSDMDYPYSPIVQEDFAGGRGLLDFERDTTRFRDSFRMRTGKSNKAFLGPQEQFTTGIRSLDQLVPGNVTFQPLLDPQGIISKRFKASASYTAGLASCLIKRIGTPNDLRIRISSDAAGARGTSLSYIDVANTRLSDTLSEWLAETMSEALTQDSYYWISFERTGADTEGSHWEIGTKSAVGSTYISNLNPVSFNAASFDVYFRLATATIDNRCILINYKEVIYAIISGNSGAPKIYENGYRGAADSNAGALDKLKDADASWPTNALVGSVALVIDGPGKAELTPWRVVTGNTATEATVSPAWEIEHTTATTYVLIGLNTWREITGHGLTAPVTDALVSRKGVLYCAMGDAVTARRLRAFNDAGTWKAFGHVDCTGNEAAGTKPVFLEYLPQQDKIAIANNSDASGNVSVAISDIAPPDWGTDLTWATAKPIGSKHRAITNLECYPDDQGEEALWAGKVDRPWVIPQTGNPYPMPLREMESVMSGDNFKQSLMHNVYLYFPIGNGLEQYYAGQLTDLGPNLGEGLPTNRRGPVSALAGYPGKFFAAIDAGLTGYSSVLMRDGNGWHEHYRAPYGQRIHALLFQATPGTALDRLWVYVGNDLIWLPFPSSDTNELNDPNMLYTNEGAIECARMHAGMFDVVKVSRMIKVWANELSEDECWIEIDYKLDDDTTFVPFPLKFQESPLSEHDLAGTEANPLFGLSAKEISLRLRFYTTNASKTPVLLALILEAVMRISVKFLRPLTLLLEDRQEQLDGKENDNLAGEDLDLLDKWSGDKSEGMLLMRARSSKFDGIMIFLNPVETNHIQVKNPRDEESRDRIVCTTSVQDA